MVEANVTYSSPTRWWCQCQVGGKSKILNAKCKSVTPTPALSAQRKGANQAVKAQVRPEECRHANRFGTSATRSAECRHQHPPTPLHSPCLPLDLHTPYTHRASVASTLQEPSHPPCNHAEPTAFPLGLDSSLCLQRPVSTRAARDQPSNPTQGPAQSHANRQTQRHSDGGSSRSSRWRCEHSRLGRSRQHRPEYVRGRLRVRRHRTPFGAFELRSGPSVESRPASTMVQLCHDHCTSLFQPPLPTVLLFQCKALSRLT